MNKQSHTELRGPARGPLILNLRPRLAPIWFSLAYSSKLLSMFKKSLVERWFLSDLRFSLWFDLIMASNLVCVKLSCIRHKCEAAGQLNYKLRGSKEELYFIKKIKI
ncbi:hypothetical protein BpHYR1_045755 [Brachionus plicatilis]|uniref:Uncharacterized protein n=1 Tax=Brachionus plicatilis TaxID=10195 RepID=A0A3M7RDB6_BRAPC|nr:hypothetical protein BpHYR1_045755 [Brachionus plicatilis]